jgi:capsular exopolysaccharide synthesis family protein
VPGEGKSTVALNLASALGQMERTLVIGGDLRRPSLAKIAGLASGHRGLSQFVAGSAELEDCIEYLEDLNIHVMPSGVIPPNPLEMISSNKFVDALALLVEQFDRIVIDSAPVQVVSDALILASYANAVVYVVKADSTPAMQIQKGIASIAGSNEPFIGVVLNYYNTRPNSDYYPGEYFQDEVGSSSYESREVS